MTTQLQPPAHARHEPPAGRVRRLALGPSGDPRWTRPALWAVLALAAALYGWGLSRNGYANEFYAAAVKSGTQSWKAFFFGSLDSASFITVDKPPMALWVMELTARVFGFGTWSLLLPQVLIGVATVAVLYATVRRASGPVAGVLAALVMTLTPITVAIDRDDNPDTLLVFFLVLAAWACLRALESGRLRWLLASAFFVGCGFNTKMLQAWIVLPALTLVYLFLAPGGWGRRIGHLLAAGVVLAVSSFWWMTVVDLTPASGRPYIGGSSDGTAWNLIIGYNGIGRITGQGGGPGGGGAPGGGRGFGGFAGQSGIGRMFGDTLGGQISWLLPFAALALVALLVRYRRRPRTDLPRAALLLWGGWLAVHFVVFSYANGIMHPYYTTAMAPAIAALAAAGAVELPGAASRRASGVDGEGRAVRAASEETSPTRRRGVASRRASGVDGEGRAVRVASEETSPVGAAGPAWETEPGDELSMAGWGGFGSRAWSWVLPLGIAGTGGWAAVLLRRTPSWHPWLAWTVAGLAVAAALGLLAVRLGRVRVAGLAAVATAAGLVAGLAGPAAYAASAAGARTEGGNPMAGPVSGRMGFPGGGRGAAGGRMPARVREMIEEGRLPGFPGGGFPGRAAGGRGEANGLAGAPGAGGQGATPGIPGGQVGATGTAGRQGQVGTGRTGGGLQGGGVGFAGRMGGVSGAMLSYLEKHQDGATWLVAVADSQAAASIILQTGRPAISMFGFVGGDNAMTVPKLRQLVKAGRLHYVLAGGGGPGGGFRGGLGGGGNSAAVTSWVTKNCTAVKASDYGASSSPAQGGESLYRCG